jgi:hypothetical protein
MEDAWGMSPLMYTIWGSAPSEIIQLLVDSYQLHYPNHAFNWSTMVMTLGRVNAPPAVIKNLLDVHHCLCPEQVIDWSNILTELVIVFVDYAIGTKLETFYFLTLCSIAKRVKAIRVKFWRDSMASQCRDNMIKLLCNKQNWLTKIHSNLTDYESEYRKLKEAALVLGLVLQLAVWKAKINESRRDDVVSEDVDNKK